ncbi:DUF3306 domain-containing protein [Polynucleobacter ibericus]|uniref:DUF3306 domain-containing protein n=1 Tax=Polynucleobacter ibericus TaxID=1819725 RepID=UPI001BFD7242|nr:DUF3306 domain-containing protein [Polynucleobacter ibericus]QWE09169.1 DUF3306 domain-containing protein [Polynucleobacter ibericus]
MADGFLGRWSRRKAGVEADALEKKVDTPKELAPAPSIEKAVEEAPPPPTLDDVAKIDRFDPDFSAFMKPDVDPTVQQAALKKMFTDPHFNIMDGLDIYIDDYSKPDPLPPGMLERMVQSDMLNLFKKTPEEAPSDIQETEIQASKPELETDTLELQKQIDLTSSQQIPSAPLDKVSDEPSIESEPKKT